MYVWTGPWTRVRDPTPLLRHLAGDFASRINVLWPAPHTDFLAAPAGRRQLVCLAMSRADGLPVGIEDALTASFKGALRRLVPDAPQGLLRALEHLGETAWDGDSYGLLLKALADPARAKALRHASLITRADIDRLLAIPDPLVRAGMVRLSLSDAQVALLSEAYNLILTRSGPDAAARAVEAWGRAASVKALFERVGSDLVRDLPPHPFAGSAVLRPLRSKSDMRKAAARYRNCLASHRIEFAASGEYAYFEWTTNPGAIIEVTRDAIYGWRLSEAAIAGNDAVPKPLRRVLADDLRAIGVHVGRSQYDMRDLLRNAHEVTFKMVPLEEAFDDAF
ncbi:MAG: hypothetical protein ACK4RV_00720 [Caulobacter sp.]